jgi:hypothetical protein
VIATLVRMSDKIVDSIFLITAGVIVHANAYFHLPCFCNVLYCVFFSLQIYLFHLKKHPMFLDSEILIGFRILKPLFRYLRLSAICSQTINEVVIRRFNRQFDERFGSTIQLVNVSRIKILLKHGTAWESIFKKRTQNLI